MKRFLLSMLAATTIACGTTHHVAPVAVQPVKVSDPVTQEDITPKVVTTTVAHDNWSIVVPSGWKYSDAVSAEGDITNVFEAKTTENIGRGPVLFTLSTIPVEVKDSTKFPVFIQMLAETGELFPDAEVLKSKTVEFDSRQSGETLMQTSVGVGMIILSTATNGTGYVLICGGDIKADTSKVVESCKEILSTFHAK